MRRDMGPGRSPTPASPLLAAQTAEEAQDGGHDPETCKVWRAPLQGEGGLISNDGPRENPQPALLEGRIPPGGRALEFKTDAGQYLTVSLDAHTEALMPGRLEQGQCYRLVLREHDAGSLAFDRL